MKINSTWNSGRGDALTIDGANYSFGITFYYLFKVVLESIAY